MAEPHEEDLAKQLIDRLMEHPNEIFIGKHFLGCYVLELGQLILIKGDYRHLSTEEAHELIIESYTADLVSRN